LPVLSFADDLAVALFTVNDFLKKDKLYGKIF
jgi:hypothetical protein